MSDFVQFSPRRKAAILLLRLGTEHSAPLLRSLRRSELNMIVSEVAALGRVDLDTAAGATDLLDLSGVGGGLSANRSVYAFRTDSNVALNGFKNQYGGLEDVHLLMALSVLTMIPCIVLFIAAQKPFVEGLARGAVKG